MTERRLLTSLLALVALAGLGAVVQAKVLTPTQPHFKLKVSPQVTEVTAGRALLVGVELERVAGYDKDVRLAVRGLPTGAVAVWTMPDGRSLPRAAQPGARSARLRSPVLADDAADAVLTIYTPRTARGRFTPVVTATRKSIRRKRTLHLDVRAPQGFSAGSGGGGAGASGSASETTTTTSSTTSGNSASGPKDGQPIVPQPADPGADDGDATGGDDDDETPVPMQLIASPASRTVLQGDTTTYTVQLENATGAPPTLTVTGLPTGATATAGDWSSATPQTATVTVEAGPDTPTGTSSLTIAGGGAAAATSLTVQETVDFGMSGGVVANLSPGATQPVALTFSNPYDFDLKVTEIDIAVSTSNDGCDPDENFEVREPDLTTPLTVPPGSSSVETLIADPGERPALTMKNTAADQEACAGRSLTLTYSGLAGK